MKTLLRLTPPVLAAIVVASAAAQPSDEPLPPISTLAASTFTVATTFRSVVPTFPVRDHLDATWTAHFDTGRTYTLGYGVGRGPGSDGVFVVSTDVEDFTYYNAGEALEWVRVCIRPRGSRIDTEVTGPDGNPFCDNIDTGGYRHGYVEEPYGPTTHDLDVAQMVASVRAQALQQRRQDGVTPATYPAGTVSRRT